MLAVAISTQSVTRAGPVPKYINASRVKTSPIEMATVVALGSRRLTEATKIEVKVRSSQKSVYVPESQKRHAYAVGIAAA